MQTKVQRNSLSKAISVASRAVSPTPVIPLLGNILLQSMNGTSRVSATNIEIGVTCEFETEGEEFEICVPAKTFTELVNALYSDEITITMNEETQSITVETESSRTLVKGMPSEDFPAIPKVENLNIMMVVQQFKEMVNRVAFAAKKQDNQSPLSGVLLSVTTEEVQLKSKDGKAKTKSKQIAEFVMFATDGFHISFEKTSQLMGKSKDMNVVVRADILELVSRLLPNEGIMYIEAQDNKVLFQCDEISIVTQVMGTEFPDYNLVSAVVPNDITAKTTVTVNTLELLRACKQLKVFATETSRTKLEIGGVIIKYSIETQNRGNSHVEIVGVCSGQPITIGINVHFLLAFLEVCKTPQTVIQMKDPKSPIRFSMKGYEDYYHVIMPIALEKSGDG